MDWCWNYCVYLFYQRLFLKYISFHKPPHIPAFRLYHSRRQIRPLAVADCAGEVVAGWRDEEEHVRGFVDDGQGQRQSHSGRFAVWGIDGDDPALFFVERLLVAGEEGCGVGVVAETEVDEVEGGRGVVAGVFAEEAPEQQFVAAGVSLGVARFGRHFVDVRGFEADVADERFAGHAVVAVGVARRQVALVAHEEQRVRPGERDRLRVARAAAHLLRQGVAKLQVSRFGDALGELLVQRSRGVAAREHKREAATLGQRAIGRVGDEGGGTFEKRLVRLADPVCHRYSFGG